MKLLRKTSRTYLIISGTAFLIAGAIIYFVLSFIFDDQLKEKLLSDIDGITVTIRKNGALPNYYPFIEVKVAGGKSLKPYETIDTLIFDPSEQENVPFRQISKVDTINGQKYYIAARDTLLEKSDLLLTIVIVIGSVFILLLISLYTINRKLSLKIWAPFYKTLDNLKTFSHDNPDFRLSEVTEIEEFIELNKALKELTTKIVSDFQSLKRFTEDASHEIQTPLSVIQSKLETLLQDSELKKDQVDFIKSAYSSSIRISKLTQTLLLLTKIANDQFPDKQMVNISGLIEEKMQIFEDHIISKSLKIKKQIEPECFLKTNIFLAESMIINLFGNAVKHCNDEGCLNVFLDKRHLEISNTGPALSVLSSKLFERFYKGDNSSGSHGLGLSIVMEICNLNKWQIRYEYEDNLHKFIVDF
jgi:signal transduction histidine kinase